MSGEGVAGPTKGRRLVALKCWYFFMICVHDACMSIFRKKKSGIHGRGDALSFPVSGASQNGERFRDERGADASNLQASWLLRDPGLSCRVNQRKLIVFCEVKRTLYGLFGPCRHITR